MPAPEFNRDCRKNPLLFEGMWGHAQWGLGKCIHPRRHLPPLALSNAEGGVPPHPGKHVMQRGHGATPSRNMIHEAEGGAVPEGSDKRGIRWHALAWHQILAETQLLVALAWTKGLRGAVCFITSLIICVPRHESAVRVRLVRGAAH